MDDRPQRIADYFVVVGLGGYSATKFEPLGDLELEVAVDPAPGGHSGCEGVEPLTDVSLIHSKVEQLPQGYNGGMKVKIKSWSAVAVWKWMTNDSECGICRLPFDGCCPDCRLPGDDCPLVTGRCKHCFHMHCIMKWLAAQQMQQHCPMCRQEWQFSD